MRVTEVRHVRVVHKERVLLLRTILVSLHLLHLLHVLSLLRPGLGGCLLRFRALAVDMWHHHGIHWLTAILALGVRDVEKVGIYDRLWRLTYAR